MYKFRELAILNENNNLKIVYSAWLNLFRKSRGIILNCLIKELRVNDLYTIKTKKYTTKLIISLPNSNEIF